jgi:hypothetical protein
MGIELLQFDGAERIGNRDAVGYYYTVRLSPDEQSKRIAVLFSGTVYVSSDAFDLPKIEGKGERFRIFSEAAIGDELDERGISEEMFKVKSIVQIECFSEHFQTWETRPRASDDEIESYIARHLFWSWTFGREGWELGLSDCLRLHRPLRFIQRIVKLGEGADWTVRAHNEHSSWIVPSSRFLRRFRESSRRSVKAPRVLDKHKSADDRPIPQATASMEEEDGYQVALSFAGEDRDYVDAVASYLKREAIRVFYDRFEDVELWGKNLVDHLGDVYASKSRFVVMFVSKHYADKAWPNYERQQAQAKAIRQTTEFILPVRFDDTQIPGLPASVAYLDARSLKPEEIAARILKKLGPRA